MDSTQEERHMTKVQLSEVTLARRRVLDVITQLQTVEEDLGRKAEQLRQSLDLATEDVGEYRRVREACTPPSRAPLDALKENIQKLVQQKTRLNIPASNTIRERIEKLTVRGDTAATLFNPMTVTPQLLLSFTPRHADDINQDIRWISSVIATQDGRLVMADRSNKMVKIASGTNLETILAVMLYDEPWVLALLHDGLVAVTSGSKSLHLLDVTGPPFVVSRVETARQYWGLSAGVTPDTLIVSCDKHGGEPAKIDVITRDGDVINTVIDSGTLRKMSVPEYMCRVGQHVFVSDRRSYKVFRIDLATGRVVATLEHDDIKCPNQVASDQANNLYIACSGSQCVLVMSGDGGQFRRLVDHCQHGVGDYVVPFGVCVTGSRLAVVWKHPYSYDSTVAVYELA